MADRSNRSLFGRVNRTESGDATDVLVGCAAVVACLVVAVLTVAAIFGLYATFKNIGRTQARADARNSVKITEIEITNQGQRVKVAKQKAEIRKQDAIGVREAQDEIAKTLTPLYVQFEMVDALKQIATSGSNNSVVYIPAGANGIPLVSNVAQGQVGQPTNAGK